MIYQSHYMEILTASHWHLERSEWFSRNSIKETLYSRPSGVIRTLLQLSKIFLLSVCTAAANTTSPIPCVYYALGRVNFFISQDTLFNMKDLSQMRRLTPKTAWSVQPSSSPGRLKFTYCRQYCEKAPDQKCWFWASRIDIFPFFNCLFSAPI